MTRRGFGYLVTWVAALVGCREKLGGAPAGGQLAPAMDASPADGGLLRAEPERVRQASARVAAQSDETIRQESRRLGPLLAQFLRAGRARVIPGATTQDVADALVDHCLREGLEPAMLGYQRWSR